MNQEILAVGLAILSCFHLTFAIKFGDTAAIFEMAVKFGCPINPNMANEIAHQHFLI